MKNNIPGERKYIDGRYKGTTDTGAMSSLKIPLPVKAKYKPLKLDDDDTPPKQVIRQQQASRHYKKK
jgi:hypothetical protein